MTSACTTVGKPSAGSPPTRREGDSGLASSGCACSRAMSSRMRPSNSASVISGLFST